MCILDKSTIWIKQDACSVADENLKTNALQWETELIKTQQICSTFNEQIFDNTALEDKIAHKDEKFNKQWTLFCYFDERL